MKVNCPSCSAKYVIADHKVRGKRIKIRCRSCKNQIPVDGTNVEENGEVRPALGEPPAPAPESAAADKVPTEPAPDGLATAAGTTPAPTGASEVWSVNLTDDDNREMSHAELLEAYRTGVIPDDAFVWNEGFDDWQPLLDVPELAPLLSRDAGAAQAPRAPLPKAPSTARVAKAPSKDLFAMKDIVHPDDDPNQLMDMDKLTGERNENSVLFSLDALKSDFGKQMAPPAGSSTKTADPFDPLGMGGPPSVGGLGGFGVDNAALLTAPAPPKPKPKPKPVAATSGEAGAAADDKKRLIMIGGAAAAAILVIGGVALALSGGDDEEKAGAAASASATRLAQVREQERKDEESKNAEEKQPTVEKKPEQKDDLEKAAESAGSKEEEAAQKGAEKDTASVEKGSAASRTSTGRQSTSSTKTRTAKTSKAKTRAAADTGGSAPFNTGAARSSLGSAAGSASACKIPGGPTGSGKVLVTFAPSGRVTSANVVGGKFGGSSVGGCIASRFRRARVPPFSGKAVTVSKSFTIR